MRLVFAASSRRPLTASVNTEFSISAHDLRLHYGDTDGPSALKHMRAKVRWCISHMFWVSLQANGLHFPLNSVQTRSIWKVLVVLGALTCSYT